MAFEKSGHRVVSLSEAPAAPAKIRETRPDLIICDISMPAVDGFQLIGQIRRPPDPVEAPVVFFSAVGGDEVVCRAFELGAVDFVRKPASVVELLARVSARLSRPGAGRKADLRGNLSLMTVADLITAAESARKSAELKVTHNGQPSEIRLRNGRIVSASHNGESGERALYRIIALPDGEFEMTIISGDGITGPLNLEPRFALMESARLKDEGLI